MKDKEKQIEEMAKVIKNTWLVDLEGNTQDVCEVLDQVDIESIARELYEKGYRKLPEDSVVLSREEYKRLLDNAIRVDMEYLDHELVKASKETAEKILKDVQKKITQLRLNGHLSREQDIRLSRFLVGKAQDYGIDVEIKE